MEDFNKRFLSIGNDEKMLIYFFCFVFLNDFGQSNVDLIPKTIQ